MPYKEPLLLASFSKRIGEAALAAGSSEKTDKGKLIEIPSSPSASQSSPTVAAVESEEEEEEEIENDGEPIKVEEEELKTITEMEPPKSQPQSSEEEEHVSVAEVKKEPQQSADVEDEQLQPLEKRLKQISEEVEKLNHQNNNKNDEMTVIGGQSYQSLSDLLKTLRPNDKKVSSTHQAQIDSDYSNTMRVLGDDGRNFKNSDIKKIEISL